MQNTSVQTTYGKVGLVSKNLLYFSFFKNLEILTFKKYNPDSGF